MSKGHGCPCLKNLNANCLRLKNLNAILDEDRDGRTDRGNTICSFYYSLNDGGIKKTVEIRENTVFTTYCFCGEIRKMKFFKSKTYFNE